MTAEPLLDDSPAVFGRADELQRIEEALDSSYCSGILIEGEIGIGKSLLSREIHRRRGDRELWLRADSVLSSAPFGVFGLVVDLDRDPETVLPRVVAALTAEDTAPVVFVDDVQHLDEHSVRVLSQLANDRAIRILATARRATRNENLPFADLVDERVLDHLVLDVLPHEAFRELMEDFLGGIASQGAIDIVAFHSGRNPGKLLELLRYTRRKNRFLLRHGVWLLDGADIDYDDRARDFTRADLTQYSQSEREALELVVLAGEIEVELMLSTGLGSAADALVAIGELRIEHRDQGVRAYVAVENHASETIRYTVPIGRSREKFEMVSAYPDAPSERARILRAEWGLGCGAEFDEQDLIDAARIAIRHGEWHRALRLLTQVPTDRMAAHELFDLARLYCDSGKIPLGLDVLAQCLEKSCCPSVIVDSMVVWFHHDFERRSPAIEYDAFTRALKRLRGEGGREARPGCPGGELDHERAAVLLERIDMLFHQGRPAALPVSPEQVLDRTLPETFRVLVAVGHASELLDAGRGHEAFAMLAHTRRTYQSLGTGMLLLKMMQVRILIQQGELKEAKQRLLSLPTHDIAYLAARSGPSDILWAQIHLLEGRLPEAARALRAGVEGLAYWNQVPLLAAALGTLEHVSMLRGEVDAADDCHSRFSQLSHTRPYIEYKRGLVHALVARWMRTGDPLYQGQLQELLDEAMAAGAYGIAALIRFLRFRHFDEMDPAAMCWLAKQGTDYELRLLGALGPALRDRDASAMNEFVQEHGQSMPDVAAKCRELARSFRPGDSNSGQVRAGDGLTARERQISRLIITGMSNAEIGEELGVALRTVEGHTYRLYRKLGITSRGEVAAALRQLEHSSTG